MWNFHKPMGILHCLSNYCWSHLSNTKTFKDLFLFCFVSDVFLFYYFFNRSLLGIIASQYCVSFCCTTKQISRMHTRVPISAPSCVSLPPSLSHPARWSQSTELISLCYAAASHQPTILHAVVHIWRCNSHFAPASPSHPISSSHLLTVVAFSPSLLPLLHYPRFKLWLCSLTRPPQFFLHPQQVWSF